jgi:4-hydroxythreonine-4-phosphate dehydrogenase
MSRPLIAVTMGDPGGVGPEVIAKTFRKFKPSSKFQYVITGSEEPFALLKKKTGLGISIPVIHSLSEIRKAPVYFWNVFQGPVHPGRVSLSNAKGAFAALEAAAHAAAAGKIRAIVTAPLNKTSMRLMDPDFTGHTEYLAAVSKTKKFAMMFYGPKLKVTLATIHVPVRKVSALITRGLVFEKIELTHQFFKNFFRKTPRIAVCALNPHGRETGTEDEAEIRPAVEKAKRRGMNASGPLSADQLFFDAYEGRFDAVIAMYHDQGLAPFKMISFRDGVNVTLGLPFVRTSPDHGTAFDIAYKGQADPVSLQSSLSLAEKLITSRAFPA